ncbi:hypothetical protein [Mariniplasma anaerobium]|uniref:Uncharacterized protein n=1 Tax=Mariniplasma anaerobium TaxID=2735436 RepID=A0A7U9TGZ3_9MOLU|nr:hypothetical protein [Mariniplasma anaerobium]BCR35817.1 hypothetical protein MPAN_007100 [Mariniplasma anaerobium]
MEFIKENFEIIVILLFILLIVLSVIVLSFNKYFAMYFSNKKFHIASHFEIDAKDENKMFTIDIYNRNINDVRLSGFGFVYKDRNIDFYKSYLEHKQLPVDHKVVISSRDYLSTKIEINTLKNIISDINHGSLYMDSLQAYVTDSLGLTSRTNAKQIKSQIEEILRYEKKMKHLEIKKQKQKLKNEAKLFKQRAIIERRIKRKERQAKIILGFKKMVSKVKGNKNKS